ncbi:T1SS secreted agglutinin RTX [Candidatus Rhodobacter oscarellae]|uniref:T1SS secreted agglutinin RTX n=1 Tax=Candidatus Rhodobacter oscarellae TaxID=1675527 RepID=A0A0J9ECE0_9RHOB|nr:Ig-like domain-containing protein [Candidatus Rhodobacter lobularis]KMW60311.1 T1SS secreted agglutinin RTX [Candidatus Rhodobacter lobularis]
MLAINYVVRDAAGSVRTGAFPEGNPATIYASYSKDVSLNLSASAVSSYAREGNDLVLNLADGQVLVVSGYFDEGATGPKNLFLSEQGDLVEVFLGDAQEGPLTASYAGLDVSGKWSAYDDLVFLDLGRVEPVVAPIAAPLFGGLSGLGAAGGALAAVAVIGGGGGGDGGGDSTSTVIQPTVDDPNSTQEVGGTTGVAPIVSGTGAPDSSVTVTVGDQTVTTTVDPNGVWVATFDPNDLPVDGVHPATVAVEDPDGNTFDLTGPTIDVDTTPPDVAVTSGAQSSGDFVNGASHSGGAEISGTGEAGATVSVTIDGTTHVTTVSDSGTWSVTFDAAEIKTGEYQTGITIVSTDPRGNSTTISETLVVDTEAPLAALNAVEGDNVVNAVEASDGVTLSGAGEPGATISIAFQGITREVTVDASGTWSMGFAASEIQPGTYDSDIVLTTTDQYGNSSSLTQSIRVDTEQVLTMDVSSGGDHVINAAEQSAGVTVTGTAEPGSTVDVTMGTVTHQIVANSSGTWAATFASNEIPTGTYETVVTAVATDDAGNVETTTSTVQVDTENTVAIDAGQAGGDDVINAAEAGADITLTGSTEPGASVDVTVAGATVAATVAADGTWTAVFGAGSIPSGEYDTTITAVSTDAAGNSATSTAAITVDTVAGEVALSPLPIEIDDVINAVERADGVDISGTATPGMTVTVTLGRAAQAVVADAAGNWTTTFSSGSIPTGTSSLPISASITDAAGNTRTVTDAVGLDTEVLNFAQTPGAIEGDDVVNAAELADGIPLSGTVEPGSTVSVQLGAATLPASVDAAGNWSLTFPASSVPAGTYDAAITVSATDPAGNTATLSDTIRIDTEAALTVEGDQTADDVLNAVEHANGITLEGTAEPGSMVTVDLMGVTRAASVDASGNWSASFATADLPEGTYTATATITATDPAGNIATVAETFGVDTEISTPGVDAVTFSGDDVRRISTEDTVDNYAVSSLNSDGSVSAPAATISSDPTFGTEFTFDTPIPDGTNLVVTRNDDAGNNASTLLVLEDDATSISHPGTGSFDIAALNLDYGEDTSLVLTEAQIRSMSDATDELTIHGGTDDTITVSGAVNTGTTREIDGQTYNIYTIGSDGATLVVEQDVNVII